MEHDTEGDGTDENPCEIEQSTDMEQVTTRRRATVSPLPDFPNIGDEPTPARESTATSLEHKQMCQRFLQQRHHATAFRNAGLLAAENVCGVRGLYAVSAVAANKQY